MKVVNAALISSGISHALAWAAYVGCIVLFGEGQDSSIKFTLLMPVVLTGLAFLAVLLIKFRLAGSDLLVSLSAALILGLCLVGIYSLWQFEDSPAVRYPAAGLVVALSLVALFGSHIRTAVLLWLTTLLMLAICYLGVASVGGFFAPSTVALFIAAFIYTSSFLS